MRWGAARLGLALGLALGVFAPAIASLTVTAHAAETARAHALVVHAPSPSDPRYARMRMEFAGVEAVWRDAGVTFVGLFPGGDPEIMGSMPEGLSAPALRRTAPGSGAFGVRLVRADGRLVHASDSEVHRAVLLGLAMSNNGAPATAPVVSGAIAATAGHDRASSAGVSGVPVPTMRPRSAPPMSIRGSEAVTVARAEPTAAPVLPRGPRVARAAPVALPPESAASGTSARSIPSTTSTAAQRAGTAPVTTLNWGASPDAARPGTAVPVPRQREVRTVGPAIPSAVLPDAPDTPGVTGSVSLGTRAPAAANPWGPWYTRPDRVRAPSTRVAREPTEPRIVALTPPDPAPLSAALPAATLDRVRAAVREERLEGAKDNGFEAAGFDAALPLGVQARMRFAGGASLDGPDLGLALLVTRSCGAAHPPAPERGWFGGWFGR